MIVAINDQRHMSEPVLRRNFQERNKSGLWYPGGGGFGICHCKTQKTSLFLLLKSRLLPSPQIVGVFWSNSTRPLYSSASANFGAYFSETSVRGGWLWGSRVLPLLVTRLQLIWHFVELFKLYYKPSPTSFWVWRHYKFVHMPLAWCLDF